MFQMGWFNHQLVSFEGIWDVEGSIVFLPADTLDTQRGVDFKRGTPLKVYPKILGLTVVLKGYCTCIPKNIYICLKTYFVITLDPLIAVIDI